MGTKIFVATVIYQYIHLGLDVLFSIMFQEYFYCGTSFLIGIIRLFAIHGSRDVLERTNPFRATVHIGPTFHGYIIFILDPSQVFGLFITAFPVYAKTILLIITYIEVVAAIIIHYASLEPNYRGAWHRVTSVKCPNLSFVIMFYSYLC